MKKNKNPKNKTVVELKLRLEKLSLKPIDYTDSESFTRFLQDDTYFDDIVASVASSDDYTFDFRLFDSLINKTVNAEIQSKKQQHSSHEKLIHDQYKALIGDVTEIAGKKQTAEKELEEYKNELNALKGDEHYEN